MDLTLACFLLKLLSEEWDMSFMDVVNRRYSVRKYQDKAVEKQKIERCLEAVRQAPSARNAQPWKFIIVDDPEIRQKVARESAGKVVQANHFTFSAPVLAVLVTMHSDILTRVGSRFYDRQYELIDNGIAAEHFCLQAAEEGLGTCMLGIFNEKAIKKILNIPRGLRIAMVITLGYPADATPPVRKRKSLGDIASWNTF